MQIKKYKEGLYRKLSLFKKRLLLNSGEQLPNKPVVVHSIDEAAVFAHIGHQVATSRWKHIAS